MSTASRNRGLEIVIALLLLVFFGWLGAHRFYCGRPMSAVLMLAMHGLGWLTAAIGIGHILLWLWGAWMVIDVLMIVTGALKPR